MKITGEQRNAASLYWAQVLTGELKPKSLSAGKQGMPSFMADMELMHRKAYLKELESANPMWSTTFINKLDDLLEDADVSLVLRHEYQPEGLLKQAAKEAGVPERIFPTGKLSMHFDEKNHLIVGDEIIDAASFIKDVARQMTL